MSVLIHILIFITVVYANIPVNSKTKSVIYEVDLVTMNPSADIYKAQKNLQNAQFDIKKISISFSEIDKEKVLNDDTSEPRSLDTETPEKKTLVSYDETVSNLNGNMDSNTELVDNPKPDKNQTRGPSLVTIWKQQVRNVIDRSWENLQEIQSMDMSLRTTCLLQISRNGDFLNKKLLISSGNAQFDRSVLVALENIRKLPMPPVEIMSDHNSVEVTMLFAQPKLKSY